MAFRYIKGRLVCGSNANAAVDVADAVREHGGTPAYVYDIDAAQARLSRMRASLGDLRASIHYAVKANPCPAVIRAMLEGGAGADVVSGGEVQQALDAGVPASAVIFSGVGKTVAEIRFALDAGVKQINVESPSELRRVAEIAKAMGKTADVAFRMNPDVNPVTHPYITTGFRENKFGMDESFLPDLLDIVRSSGPALRLRGLTLHIGSQLLEIDVLREAIQKTKSVFLSLIAGGHALDRFDVGGGVGIDYSTGQEEPELALMDAYGAMVVAELRDLGCEILFEPGRCLVGRAGLLVGEVQYVKRAPAKTFAIVDTGMHHLLRPALYQARHRVLPLEAREGINVEPYDVVGPICESSDFLARDVQLPTVREGDWLALADAGAYGRSMASQYNAHRFPAEIAISKGAASRST